MGTAPQFRHRTLGQRVLFGTGMVGEHLTEEVAALGTQRILLVTSPRDADLGSHLLLGAPVVHHFQDVVAHVPEEVAATARREARASRADAIVVIGGGSAIGTAKAVALTMGLPVVAVPTTFAGSEATPIWGITANRRKVTGVDPAVLPRSVVYDADLVSGLPVPLAITSATNALAHCVDSLWAPDADPINAALATEGMQALAAGLRELRTNRADVGARARLQLGAYLAGVALGSAGSGLHHKICHVLGGRFNLPHAETHAAVLPHITAFNAPCSPVATHRMTSIFGGTTAAEGIDQFYEDLGTPRALRDVGFERSDIPVAVELILPAVPAGNPRPVSAEDLRQILHDAWTGKETR